MRGNACILAITRIFSKLARMIDNNDNGLFSVRKTYDNLRKRIRPYFIYMENRRVQITMYILSFIMYFVVGCTYYCIVEGWSLGTTFDFTVTTISTVGYGYTVPSNDRARLFTTFYMIFGVYFIFIGISSVITHRLEAVAESLKSKMRQKDLGRGLEFHRRMIIFISIIIVACILVGAFIFQVLEGWTFITALYFTVETVTTVGYGDIPIKHEWTHYFITGYIIIATVLLAFAINSISMLRVERRRLLGVNETTSRRKELRMVAQLDTGNGVTQSQFIMAILQQIGTLNYENDIKPWQDEFNRIDVHNTGKLSRSEIEEFSVREAAAADEDMLEIQFNLGKDATV